MNVYDNANELAKAMRESHEYKKLKEAAAVLEKDPDAKKMAAGHFESECRCSSIFERSDSFPDDADGRYQYYSGCCQRGNGREIMTLQEIFAGCTAKPLLAEEPMAKHTSFRIGGPADLMAMPQSEQELQQLLQRAGESKVPVTLIGNGSNLLVRDKGIRGLVIKLGNMLNDVVADGCTLTFGSGVSLAAASRKAAELGLSGMEFAVGIPGSIGGAVYMNAGAYDGEMAKVVTGVRVMELDGTISELAAAALDFGYRHTALQGSGKIVTAVTVRLTAGDKQAIADKMADFSNRRITKQPLELPSAGSMFKRPPGYFAGTLIDQTGLKGYTVGGAQVSEKHAGFVVNIGGATAADVLQLICDVQDKVFAAHGVHLEPEVLVLGEE